MKRKQREWRVEITHVNGYTAPSIYTQTEEGRLWKAEATALMIAKSQSRLADFTQYSFIAVNLTDEEE
jgi:hypothetical protein